MSSTWFTSDHHFGHERIMELIPDRRRRFGCVERMTEGMIEAWNERVAPGDVVFHLGDFSLGLDAEAIAGIVARLNGRITLVRGNHDRPGTHALLSAGFVGVKKKIYLEDPSHGSWLLNHKPLFEEAAHRVICGHVHDKWTAQGNCVNVGVDVHGFYPISLAEIEDFYEQRVS